MSQQNLLEHQEEIQQASNVFEFDDDTGVLSEDKELQNTISNLEKVLYQANAFQQMTDTEGWCILKKFVDGVIADHTTQLIIEKDFERIKRYQSEIIAFQSIFNIVEESFIDAKKAKEQLDLINRPV